MSQVTKLGHKITKMLGILETSLEKYNLPGQDVQVGGAVDAQKINDMIGQLHKLETGGHTFLFNSQEDKARFHSGSDGVGGGGGGGGGASTSSDAPVSSENIAGKFLNAKFKLRIGKYNKTYDLGEIPMSYEPSDSENIQVYEPPSQGYFVVDFGGSDFKIYSKLSIEKNESGTYVKKHLNEFAEYKYDDEKHKAIYFSETDLTKDITYNKKKQGILNHPELVVKILKEHAKTWVKLLGDAYKTLYVRSGSLIKNAAGEFAENNNYAKILKIIKTYNESRGSSRNGGGGGGGGGGGDEDSGDESGDDDDKREKLSELPELHDKPILENSVNDVFGRLDKTNGVLLDNEDNKVSSLEPGHHVITGGPLSYGYPFKTFIPNEPDKLQISDKNRKTKDIEIKIPNLLDPKGVDYKYLYYIYAYKALIDGDKLKPTKDIVLFGPTGSNPTISVIKKDDKQHKMYIYEFPGKGFVSTGEATPQKPVTKETASEEFNGLEVREPVVVPIERTKHPNVSKYLNNEEDGEADDDEMY